MKWPTQLFLLILLSIATPVQSTTYYLDFGNGSNASDGLSPSTAWKDLFKIRAALPAPGDTFLLKRGERWDVRQMYIDASGTATQPIVYGAYGDPSAPLPIVSNVTPINGANFPANWTQVESNVWTFHLPNESPGRLFLDEVEYLRSSTLATLGTTDNEGALGQWYYDSDTDLLYIYASQNPASLYTHITGSEVFYSVLVLAADYLEFENLDLRGGNGTSLGILGSSHIRISQCQIGKWGNSGIILDDFSGTPSAFISISQNTFDSDFTFYYGLGSERGCGDGINLADAVHNCEVSQNTFINWAHNAIELLADDPAAQGVYTNQFYDNYITAPDIPYAHPLGADGLLNKCTHNEFYRNFIENCRTASQVNGNDNWVHHNIIRGMRRSPSKNEPTAHAFNLGIYQPNFVSQDNRFDHNLIMDTDESAFLIRGYGFASQAKNISIRNNILYETGLNPYNDAYPKGTTILLYDTELDGLGGNTFQHNLFYSSLGRAYAVFLQDEPNSYSVRAFNQLNGVDGNVIAGNIFGNPLFTDLDNGNYLPQFASPAVNAGISVDLALDYSLAPRIVGTIPDIGPLETQVGKPWEEITLKVLGNNKVQLKWEGNSSRFSRYYRVERKSKGQAWKQIGRLKARSNSPKPVRYVYQDKRTPTGTLKYRVLRVDRNGAVSYSKTLSTTIETRSTLSLARPNSESIQLISQGEWDWSQSQVGLYRHDGHKLGLTSGSASISIQGLPHGLYFLKIQWGKRTEIIKFIR